MVIPLRKSVRIDQPGQIIIIQRTEVCPVASEARESGLWRLLRGPGRAESEPAKHGMNEGLYLAISSDLQS